MEREYRLGGKVVRNFQLQYRITVGLGVLAFLVAAALGEPWGGAGAAVSIFFVAFFLKHGLKMDLNVGVVVEAEGLRYAHIPESPLVPWAEIQSVRERRLAQRLELVAADGETRISLDYHLDGFGELAALVAAKVPLARKAPVRFRRSWGYDISMVSFVLLVSIGSLWVSLWMKGALLVTWLVLLHEESKSPYAAEVTDRHLILSFVFRRLAIPLQELRWSSATEQHQGMVVPLLQVEEPETQRPLFIRNVGVDMIVLKATIQEAMRAARV